MTADQCKKFMDAVEAAEIKSYQFVTDIPSNLYNNGETAIIKPSYANECIVAFRSIKYNGSHNVFDENINVVMADFADVHEVRTAGNYDQIKKFVDSFGLDLSDDDFKVLLKIDKGNYDIKPETGNYVDAFKYLSAKQYEALSDKEKAEYDAAKEEYEKAKREYIPVNQAASITLS